jgi:hypothetical protein
MEKLTLPCVRHISNFPSPPQFLDHNRLSIFKVRGSNETVVPVYQTTRYHILNDYNFESQISDYWSVIASGICLVVRWNRSFQRNLQHPSSGSKSSNEHESCNKQFTACVMLVCFFDPEFGGGMFLRNGGWLFNRLHSPLQMLTSCAECSLYVVSHLKIRSEVYTVQRSVSCQILNGASELPSASLGTMSVALEFW